MPISAGRDFEQSGGEAAGRDAVSARVDVNVPGGMSGANVPLRDTQAGIAVRLGTIEDAYMHIARDIGNINAVLVRWEAENNERERRMDAMERLVEKTGLAVFGNGGLGIKRWERITRTMAIAGIIFAAMALLAIITLSTQFNTILQQLANGAIK